MRQRSRKRSKPRSHMPTFLRKRQQAEQRKRIALFTVIGLFLIGGGYGVWQLLPTMQTAIVSLWPDSEPSPVVIQTPSPTIDANQPTAETPGTAVPPPQTGTPTPGSQPENEEEIVENLQVPPISDLPMALDNRQLEQVMLEAINQDRQENGLQPVQWDTMAAYAGALHASDMAQNNYFSHWSLSGHGPPYRYTQAGGRHNVRENISLASGQFDDFTTVIRDAQQGLMDSPGHQENILFPAHTHVGVGFAHNVQTGTFYLVQEFVNRYVQVDPIPLQTQLGTTIDISGTLLDTAQDPIINLAYRPFPTPLSVAEANAQDTYKNPAETVNVISPRINADRTFLARVKLDHSGLAGLYYVRTFVTVADQAILASEIVVEVQTTP